MCLSLFRERGISNLCRKTKTMNSSYVDKNYKEQLLLFSNN